MLKQIFRKISSLFNTEEAPNKNIGVAYHRKQTLEARVIKACAHCGASGVDIYGHPVGSICPSCNRARPADEDKGTVWERVY